MAIHSDWPFGPSEMPIYQAILNIESWLDDHPEALCIEDGWSIIQERKVREARLSQLHELRTLRTPIECRECPPLHDSTDHMGLHMGRNV